MKVYVCIQEEIGKFGKDICDSSCSMVHVYTKEEDAAKWVAEQKDAIRAEYDCLQIQGEHASLAHFYSVVINPKYPDMRTTIWKRYYYDVKELDE